VYRERERLFWRSAKRRHQRRQQKAFDMSQDVCIRSLSQKQETRGWESLTRPGVLREQSAAEQKRGQRTHAAKKNSRGASLLNCPLHQLFQLQQTRCSTTCQSKPWARACLLAVKRAGAWLARSRSQATAGPTCDCCYSYHAEGCHVAPPYES
jgi:hypothetical protein